MMRPSTEVHAAYRRAVYLATISEGPTRMHGAAKNGFGALLRNYRAAAGISQEVLAERSGRSRRGIADLERGARNFPYGDTIRRLADALELGPEERADLLAAGHRQPLTSDDKRPPLPVDLSELVGREREISEVQLLLKSSRLLTLEEEAHAVDSVRQPHGAARGADEPGAHYV
jgi:transcriptional regulator with XRE-family HTH domain